jgi:nucleoside-diphosphate-sugar epimerase
MSNAYLVTGVPGFIGKRLVQKLLPEGRRIFLLCEPRFQAATEAMVKELGPQRPDQLVVVPGDITENDLALGANPERVKREVSAHYHHAPI